ncbi:MAG: Cell division integral membrane protein, YggT and half-length relatives [uncultured Thermoleophilia bacterium]|uniref:Cell division integral membrane protein, YggT and half-length relatives n=1 Tax=uncultured Thermoleophilia bacterium TaxID=1497501 RepID=A0A6J4UG93_9ACTN|nr:MAG: Cell division integral membrane protein, YggT and half-length relatives [uncultured Thermoleophilia bacterium]
MDGLANFIESLALIYLLMILAYVVMSMLPLPYNVWVGRIRQFLDQTVSPYLNVFRRFIPPIGMFDLSPIVAIFVLQIVSRIVVGVLRG